jgi:TetR/AcrR family transcriptional repressor of nem operon
MLDAYLSPGHVAHPEFGCVLAALGAEGTHSTGPVRKAFAEVARGFLRLVDRQARPKGRDGGISDAALETASRMIGAMVLARLVDDEKLSGRILSAARHAGIG